jgi:4-hydroxy-4-methyl-2-oxoglutarate aldolase
LAVQNFQAPTRSLTDAELSAWRTIPAAVASDELNRTSTLDAGIRPMTRNGAFVGPAVTVRVAAGDNLALHHAVSQPGHGCVLMVDAGGYGRTAVWGGILHRAAEKAGYIAVVIDGCIRDSVEIGASNVSCYARGIVPAGPHKGWGGEINSAVQVGGAVVHPGDVVLADEDGVTIIPAADQAAVLERARARVEMEAGIMQRIERGEKTVDIFNLRG